MVFEKLLIVGEGRLFPQLLSDLVVGVEELIETGDVTAPVVVVVGGILRWR
jgi:hypothetical protein